MIRYFLLFAGGGILNELLVAGLLAHDVSPGKALFLSGLTIATAVSMIEERR